MSLLARPTAAVTAGSPPVNHSEPAGNSAKSSQKSVRIYEKEELDYEALAARTKVILGQVAFGWQMEIGAAALCGEDVIVDVGTGCGKSLSFSIPLVLHETDVALRVTPLTALMIDQAASAKLRTVVLCSETLARYGAKALYEQILSDKCQEVHVSPEIAISPEFRKEVLSKRQFWGRLRVVIIDEAHCISLWGGSFRLDYGELGVLRGRLPKHVPIIVASATLPDHILDDIRVKLKLSPNAHIVRVTNARPNVALSCRPMKHAEKSKADLRFLIPVGATKPEDIDITLVYCNQRVKCEDSVDNLRFWAKELGIPESCIAFYHARIGEKRKRELEEKLRTGEIRILVCTDAVGMGCDMRNVKRVVLWELPPSFCALVQRAGRAARDFSTLGEAILIVPQSVITKGTSEMEVEAALEAVQTETENRGDEEVTTLENNGIQLVDEGGVRVGHESEDDEDEKKEEKKRRRKQTKADFNSREAKFLSLFACTTRCRRIVWDEFFANKTKYQLTPEVTVFHSLPGMRCCDNCEPRLFEVEKITIEKTSMLKRGKKRKLSPGFDDAIRKDLSQWRDNELLDKFYGGTTILAGSTLLGDDVIEKLATCGERIETVEDFAQHARWPIGFNVGMGASTEYGNMLLQRLKTIYSKFDEDAAADEARLLELHSLPIQVDTASFYGSGSSNHGQNWVNLTADMYVHNDMGSSNGDQIGRGTRSRGRPRGGNRGRATHRARI